MAKPLCAWASISEKGTVNGAKGDQTGREVKVGYLYNFGQTYVIRCKNAAKRKRIAKAAKSIAQNDYIGYGQGDRATSFREFAKIDWKISQIKDIKIKSNIDCSELALCAVNFAYNKVIIGSTNNSSSLPKAAENTKKFSVIPYKKGMKLKAGDIIGKSGHDIVALENGVAI